MSKEAVSDQLSAVSKGSGRLAALGEGNPMAPKSLRPPKEVCNAASLAARRALQSVTEI
ncbi:MAG: hypothetical protein WAO35_10115 [Terriglobia bacterium]